MLRYHKISNDERKVLSLTSLTPKEFADLVPLFTTSFYDYLDEQTVDGYERIGRRYVPYRNSTLPTMEDKVLFILVYLKQAPTQEVQASLFGMRQPKANMWIHLLHPVLNRALKQHGVSSRNLPGQVYASSHEAPKLSSEARASMRSASGGIWFVSVTRSWM